MLKPFSLSVVRSDVPQFVHAWPASMAVAMGLCAPMICCRKPPETAGASANAGVKAAGISKKQTTLSLDDDDLNCLLQTPHGRIHLQFGYRGCFGGSDNDLDLDVATTASLSGHLWTGLSTNRATDNVALNREEGRAYLGLLVGALVKEDDASDLWMTTKAFVRVSYWCGTRHEGPLTFETNVPSEEDERAFEEAFHLKHTPAARRHPYSRVHATIAAARKILASAPGKDVDSPEQHESASRRLDSLYDNGLRVRHDPVEAWKDP